MTSPSHIMKEGCTASVEANEERNLPRDHDTSLHEPAVTSNGHGMIANETENSLNAMSKPPRESHESTESQNHGHNKSFASNKKDTWSTLYDVVSFTPHRCRYDTEKPMKFSMGLNILFAFASCFTVANLYYTHPILNILSTDFNVSYQSASFIPTLAQAGYAAGLLLLCPLGDLLKRRPFVLWLVFFTAMLWIGLCITTEYKVFLAISFITGVTTVTPQLMLPLVGDLAPRERRATALSIVVSGLLLGMLIARVLSGVVARFIGWRYVYWISFALQCLILVLLWLFMPDYPATNSHQSWMGILKQYPKLLWDIVRLVFRYPVLMQACLIGFFTSSTFTSFWTTLTFLLSGPPYYYSSLIIGLFSLIGIGAMSWGPIFARTVMDKRQPLFSVILGEVICLVGVVLGTFLGKYNVAGPIIQAACIDIGLQTSQIANRTAIYNVEPKGRNRVNTAYMVSVFCGQLMGTAVGNQLYAQGGWLHSGGASIAFVGLALLLCFVRGPHEKGWIGWGGGYSMKIDHSKYLAPSNGSKSVDGEMVAGNPSQSVQAEKKTETGS